MSQLKVVGLVGRAGAGKDTVCQIMGSRFPSVRMGDVVIEETRRRGLETTDRNVGRVADDLRRKDGMDAIAKRCIDAIRRLDSPIVIVNGIRGLDEVKLFQAEFSQLILVEVRAPDKVRYERIMKRARVDDVRDFEQFLARDRREDSWGLGEAIAMARYRIDNDGGLEDLEARTSEVLRRIEADRSVAGETAHRRPDRTERDSCSS